MTFVSSFRPHQKNAEYASNQARAVQSWQSVADSVVLVGDPEPELRGRKTTFVKPNSQWPQIKELVRLCAISDDEACILNADIVVLRQFDEAVFAWHGAHGVSATSRRYQFEPESFPQNLHACKVVDQGFDFFMARRNIWKLACEKCPEKMWIGHCLWDNWMLGFLAKTSGKFFFDLTRFKFIFHPRHGGRDMPNHVEVNDDYIRHHGWGRRL